MPKRKGDVKKDVKTKSKKPKIIDVNWKVPDHLKEDLDIIVIGFNPGVARYFWKTL